MKKKILILVSGKLHSGKDTFYTQIERGFLQAGMRINRVKFAKALKDLCADAFAELCEEINTRIAKVDKILLNSDITGYDLKRVREELLPLVTRRENFYEDKTIVSRLILQPVGTEVVQPIKQTHWVEKTAERKEEFDYDIVVSTDLRFPHELEIQNHLEGFVVLKVRLERNNIDRTGPEHQHISEVALDGYTEWDSVILNEGTLEEFKESADSFVASVLGL